MGGGKERKGGKEDFTSNARIMAIEYKSDSAVTQLKPVIVGGGYNQEIGHLIDGEIKSINDKLEDLREKGNASDIKKAKHPRPGATTRSSRELRDIDINEWQNYWQTKKNTLIPIYEENLRILRGEMPGKITLHQNTEGAIDRVEISRMNERETRLWRPINEASRTVASTEGLGMIVEAFEQYSVRDGFETGRPELGSDLKDRYIQFLKQLNGPSVDVMGNAFRAMRENL